MSIKLTAEQIKTFHQMGFLVIENVFNPAEIEIMRAGFDDLQRQIDIVKDKIKNAAEDKIKHVEHNAAFTFEKSSDNSDYVLRHLAGCTALNKDLKHFGQDQRLVNLAAQLLGSDTVDHLINQAHFKLPGTAVKFAWHQDIEFRGFKRGQFKNLNGTGSYVQIAIPLDDMTAENGPLGFIPNSGQSEHYSHYSNENQYAGIADEVIDNLPKPVYPLAKTGGILLFGPFTIHGSTANLSKNSRRIFINGFAYPDANTMDYAGHKHGMTRLNKS